MIGWLKGLQRRRRRKKVLFALHAELVKNLESYYVMDQREYFKPFRIQAWQAVRLFEEISWPESVLEYARRIERYNRQLEDIERFEAFYTANMENRTRENARILHDKKEDLKALFGGFELMIKTALVDAENVMKKHVMG